MGCKEAQIREEERVRQADITRRRLGRKDAAKE